MNWKSLILMCACLVFLAGCFGGGNAQPYAAGVNPALQPTSYVPVDVQRELARQKMIAAPTKVSDSVVDGLTCMVYSDALERTAAGEVYEDQNGTPYLRTYSGGFSWNTSIDMMTAAAKKVTLGFANLFGAHGAETSPIQGMEHNSDPRNGFYFCVEDANAGGVAHDPDMIRARGEAAAMTTKAIGEALGITLDKHWAGRSGYIKVLADGRVQVIGAIGNTLTQIVGEYAKLTPLGAAGNVLEAVVGSPGGGEQTVIVSNPSR